MVESTGFENRRGFVALPGFESLPLRHIEISRYQIFPVIPYKSTLPTDDKHHDININMLVLILKAGKLAGIFL